MGRCPTKDCNARRPRGMADSTPASAASAPRAPKRTTSPKAMCAVYEAGPRQVCQATGRNGERPASSSMQHRIDWPYWASTCCRRRTLGAGHLDATDGRSPLGDQW